MPLPALVQCGALLWIGGVTLHAYRQLGAARGRGHARQIAVRFPRDIEVADAHGHSRWGALREGSFVAPWLTVIRWRPHGARFDRTILVLPDMLDAEDFRRLRVLLRWT